MHVNLRKAGGSKKGHLKLRAVRWDTGAKGMFLEVSSGIRASNPRLRDLRLVIAPNVVNCCQQLVS